MAVITISRQVAALGDEVAAVLAKQLGYRFITRKEVEKRIVELGFPEKKLPKYDERKPGFFASLAKDRDEYLDYVQFALLEAAEQGNVLFIGRGAFAVFEGVENHIALRLVADEKTRTERLMKEFNWNEKQAKQRINESDMNRTGFHKSFYNVEWAEPTNYDIILNTGVINEEIASSIVMETINKLITPEKEKQGKATIAKLLKAQTVVNKLIFEHKVKIEFLHAKIEDKTLILHGVADSIAIVEQAVRIAAEELPDYTIKSAISIIHDYKGY